MIICPAQPFDIPAIMNIERQSFIPAIQEKKRVFEKRLKLIPEGFLLLADSSEEVVKKNKVALVCGYLCAERWDSLPDFSLLNKIVHSFNKCLLSPTMYQALCQDCRYSDEQKQQWLTLVGITVVNLSIIKSHLNVHIW